MVQKSYIFKFLFIIIVFVSSSSHSKTISGKAIVTDGDSFKIGINNIRLHGIDAPEFNQTCLKNNTEWNCGKKAFSILFDLLNLKKIKCKILNQDRFDRYIAICYLKNLNINQYMVKNGWAIAYRYYSLDYIKEEEFAKKNKYGIWGGTFIEPYIFRKNQRN